MLLCIDVGNTNTNFGVWDENASQNGTGGFRFLSRINTDEEKTADEYAAIFLTILKMKGAPVSEITGAAISNVVPPLVETIDAAAERIARSLPLTVGPGVKTGLDIKIDNPAQLGADLVCAAVGAAAGFCLPCIVADLGTATKVLAIDGDGAFLGCSILPGVQISLDALSRRTAQLPRINLRGAAPVIGKNTVDSMRSGVLYGAAGALDALCRRYAAELQSSEKAVCAIATGGLAGVVVPHCEESFVVDETLVMSGLVEIYKKNRVASI